MEGRGLIQRHRDQADRRRLVVALTAGGQGLLDRYRADVAVVEAKMLADSSGRARWRGSRGGSAPAWTP
jgi:DNA-binding MarR family transcriptional regulator